METAISLEEKDLEFLDYYAVNHGLESRSVAASNAVNVLRSEELSRQYNEAFREWEGSADQKFWDQFSGDGIAATPEW